MRNWWRSVQAGPSTIQVILKFRLNHCVPTNTIWDAEIILNWRNRAMRDRPSTFWVPSVPDLPLISKFKHVFAISSRFRSDFKGYPCLDSWLVRLSCDGLSLRTEQQQIRRRARFLRLCKLSASSNLTENLNRFCWCCYSGKKHVDCISYRCCGCCSGGSWCSSGALPTLQLSSISKVRLQYQNITILIRLTYDVNGHKKTLISNRAVAAVLMCWKSWCRNPWQKVLPPLSAGARRPQRKRQSPGSVIAMNVIDDAYRAQYRNPISYLISTNCMKLLYRWWKPRYSSNRTSTFLWYLLWCSFLNLWYWTLWILYWGL